MNEILAAAADLLEQDGWCQGALSRHGKHCALGAIMASGSLSEMTGAIRKLHDVIETWRIPEWNDHPERTQTEVVAALREAARL